MNRRVILVSGANGGLGQAIARAFLDQSEENFLWLGVRKNRANAAALVEKFPNRSQVIEIDVGEREAWQKAVQHILSEHQRLDVLVNNAGKHADGLLATMPVADWSEIMTTNLEGTFHACQAVLPSMISQRFGRIINMASLSGLLAPAGQANYAAAKAGMMAMSRSLAKEVARIGITVNAVCPGFIETEALGGMDDAAKKEALVRIPMRRFGRPEEVAAAVLFLASQEASYITGSVLTIDGGIF